MKLALKLITELVKKLNYYISNVMDTKSKNISLKVILISIGFGIWTIVLQNAGITPANQNVYVNSGYLEADINGAVDEKEV